MKRFPVILNKMKLLMFASVLMCMFITCASAQDTVGSTYQFTKMDDSTYTMTENGHRKIVFFYKPECPICEGMGQSLVLTANELTNVDIIFAEFSEQYSKTDIQAEMDCYFGESDMIVFCYNAQNVADEMCLKAGVEDYGATPFVFYLDEKNRILGATKGRDNVIISAEFYRTASYEKNHLEHTMITVKEPTLDNAEMIVKCSACEATQTLHAPIEVKAVLSCDPTRYIENNNVKPGDCVTYETYCKAEDGYYYSGNYSDVISDLTVNIISSDPSVADVDETKKTITFLKDGKVTITFVSAMNKYAGCVRTFCVGDNCAVDMKGSNQSVIFVPDESERDSDTDIAGTAVNIGSNTTISLPKKKYTYTGKAIKPAAIVRNAAGEVVDGGCYSLSYTNNVKVGQGTVTANLGCEYNGKVCEIFEIVPKGTKISKIKCAKKACTVQWKKNTVQTSGYQIQYALDSKYKKSAKIVTVKKNSTTKYTIKKLKAGKKYYVRVRTYKTVNGKKFYSEWSKTKTVKIK